MDKNAKAAGVVMRKRCDEPYRDQYITAYSGDPEIGPPMGLTESGPILESVRFVKPANYEWRNTSQSVYRYALLRVDIKVD